MNEKLAAYDAINFMSDDELIKFMEELDDEAKVIFLNQARLRGRLLNQPDLSVKQLSNTIDDDEIDMDEYTVDDFDFSDKKPKRTRSSSSKTTTRKRTTQKRERSTDNGEDIVKKIQAEALHNIPDLPVFDKIKPSQEIQVTFAEHNIPYKQQLWPVYQRDVEYKIVKVTASKRAKEIAEIFSHNNNVEQQKAINGETRYFEIKSFVESLNFRVRVLGFVKVEQSASGKLKRKILVSDKLCKEHYVNYNAVLKQVENAVSQMGI